MNFCIWRAKIKKLTFICSCTKSALLCEKAAKKCNYECLYEILMIINNNNIHLEKLYTTKKHSFILI